MVVPLDSHQPVFILPPLSDIPDDDDDKPEAGLTPVRLRLISYIYVFSDSNLRII